MFCYRSLPMVFSFGYFTLPTLQQTLYRNRLMLHHDYLLSSVLFWLICLLHITFLYYTPSLRFYYVSSPFLHSIHKHAVPLDLQINTSIIGPNHSISEPQLISSNNFFNNWFRIPFQDKFNVTHIWEPHLEIVLILYSLT